MKKHKSSIKADANMEVVANCDNPATISIENRILTIRGLQVMVDRDLAELYGVDTRRLNEQVKRNIDRFPESFRFQLSNNEKDELVTNCDRLVSMPIGSPSFHFETTNMDKINNTAILPDN